MKRLIWQELSDSVEINLSPLIDMMFLLLIFFIVTTAFIEDAGIEIEKPKAQTSRPLRTKSITITVTKDGKIYHGKREINFNDIRGVINRFLINENIPVIILADKNSKSGDLIKVLDECKIAGAKEVNVATEKI